MCVQARESTALRETLHAEREAASAEVEALKATIQKLESQKHEKHQQWPVISEKEVEERRRAEEKAAQTISQLTQVLRPPNQRIIRHISKLLSAVKGFPPFLFLFNSLF